MGVMSLKIFRVCRGEKYSHSKGQENANTQVAKYQQWTPEAARVASSQLLPRSRIPVSAMSKGDAPPSLLSNANTPSGAVTAAASSMKKASGKVKASSSQPASHLKQKKKWF